MSQLEQFQFRDVLSAVKADTAYIVRKVQLSLVTILARRIGSLQIGRSEMAEVQVVSIHVDSPKIPLLRPVSICSSSCMDQPD